MSGYDVIKYLHKNFRMLPSPGTVYSILYSLERQELIEGRMDQGKRVYNLTSQGETCLKDIGITKTRIQALLSHVFSEV